MFEVYGTRCPHDLGAYHDCAEEGRHQQRGDSGNDPGRIHVAWKRLQRQGPSHTWSDGHSTRAYASCMLGARSMLGVRELLRELLGRLIGPLLRWSVRSATVCCAGKSLAGSGDQSLWSSMPSPCNVMSSSSSRGGEHGGRRGERARPARGAVCT